MKELTKIFNITESDKGTKTNPSHGFSEIYDDYLVSNKNNITKVLEIGVCSGKSLIGWSFYFPNAKIIGLDREDKSWLNTDKIQTIILDQSNEEHLKEFASKIKHKNYFFDLIVDDGSHHMKDQQITLANFFPLLKSGGIYILEDLHTSLCENGKEMYEKNIEIYDDKSNTTLNYLKEFPRDSVYLNKEQNEYLLDNIKEVKIYERENFYIGSEKYQNKSITSIIIKK